MNSTAEQAHEERPFIGSSLVLTHAQDRVMDGSDHQSSVISGRKEVLGVLAAARQTVRRTGLSVPMQRLLDLKKRSGRAMEVLA